MPYVPEKERHLLDRGQRPDDSEQLSYKLTQICLQYLETRGEKFATYNDIVGALEFAKLELFRRRISIHEDWKTRENGDVYFKKGG